MRRGLRHCRQLCGWLLGTWEFLRQCSLVSYLVLRVRLPYSVASDCNPLGYTFLQEASEARTASLFLLDRTIDSTDSCYTANGHVKNEHMLSLLNRVTAILHVSPVDGDPLLSVANQCADFLGGEVVDVDRPETEEGEGLIY